jgi:hypothetical protein
MDMKRTWVMGVLAAGMAISTTGMVGCDAKDSTGPSAVEQEAAKRANEAVSVIPGAAKESAEKAVEAGTAAVEETKKAAADATDAAKSAATDATAAASEVVASAQKILTEGMEALKNQDMATAKAKLAELEKLKDKVPASFWEQVENFKKAVQTGDVAGGVGKLLGK